MIVFPSHEFSKSHVMIRAKIIIAFDTQTSNDPGSLQLVNH